jgi:hypothetical protein
MPDPSLYDRRRADDRKLSVQFGLSLISDAADLAEEATGLAYRGHAEQVYEILVSLAEDLRAALRLLKQALEP